MIMPVGRKPKPSNLKVIEGNPGKRPLPENEPKPAPVIETPAPPGWLNKDGKQMWKDRVPDLINIGLLTNIDIDSFAMCCHVYGVFREAERDIKKKGRYHKYVNKFGAENEVERPQAKTANKAYAEYCKMMSEFGLSPASRTRIEVKPAEDGQDPMEALLSGVK